MPNESRVISFSNAEAIDALVDYCSTNKRELPKGGIKRLSFSNDSEIRVTAEFDNATPSISFYENEVAVALILRCNKKAFRFHDERSSRCRLLRTPLPSSSRCEPDPNRIPTLGWLS